MVILVVGGASSGKSAFAEKQMLKHPTKERIYLATMASSDAESGRRIERHRKMRKGKGFFTLECPCAIHKADVPKGADVLLECISNLVANEMFMTGGAGEKTVDAVVSAVKQLKQRCDLLVVVSSDVARDGCRYDELTEQYIQNMVQINQQISALADQVFEVVCGIPVRVKGG